METMELNELAKSKKDILKPFGEIEVLLYYGSVAEELKEFLKNKELAARNWVKKNYSIIKRGSELSPLYIKDLIKEITAEFLKVRGEDKSLKEAKDKLNDKQQLIWRYFLPRKFSDLFYAFNHEGEGRPIKNVYYDVDIGEGRDAKDSLKVVREFIRILREEAEEKIGELKIWPCWTGASFHIYLFLKEKRPHNFYEKKIKFSKNTPAETLTEKWIQKLRKRIEIPIVGGHEEVKGKINIDPSQTPSGKLDRAPFSLHVANAGEVDGVSVPLELEELEEPDLIEKLESYTPKEVLENLGSLSKKLPSRSVV